MDEINESNILYVMQKVMPTHQANIRQIKFLEDYEKGRQPILERIKEVRPEINERIVVNVAHEVTAFKTAFEFGDPITYALRDYAHKEDVNRQKEELIERMNEMFFSENKEAKDQALANAFLIGGVSYRGAFAKDDPDTGSSFEIVNLDPKEAFVVYSLGVPHRKVMAGTHFTVMGDDGVMHTRFRCYTKDRVYDLECPENMYSGFRLIDVRLNGMGIIPIVEYKCDYQRMGCFERAVRLMDALNLVESDRCNGLAQTVQSLLWFDNVDLDDEAFRELKEKGAIATTSKDGLNSNIEYISVPLDQQNQQSLANDLYDKIVRITAIPGREQATGGNTGQAIMLGGSGWQLAEEAADQAEMIFKESDREMLATVIHIMRLMDPTLQRLSATDVDVKFARNRVSNLLTKTQGLLNLLSAGIHPQVAITNSDLFSDPQQVYMNSIPYLEKWLVPGEPAEAETGDPNGKVVDSAEG
jgi:SPP1 family phage portal protein